MSLLIVGSCSRVTQGIVASLAAKQLYQTITILDLLPLYDFHQRFYGLQKQLASTKAPLNLNINKITRVEELAANIRNHRDLLYVTHDYFQSVTSKTKLMELTAKLSAQRNAVFATPLQYDHFGLPDPQGAFNASQEAVLKSNPNATFIRSDIQDSTQFLAYLHHPKNLIEQKLFNIPSSFRPRVASSSEFNEAVIEALKGGRKGETQTISGEERDPLAVGYNQEISTSQARHFCENASNILKKYRSLQTAAQRSA